MTRGAAFRGQPLLVLTALLAGWMGTRAALWQTPFAPAPEPQQSFAASKPQRFAPRPGERLMAFAGLGATRRYPDQPASWPRIPAPRARDRSRTPRLAIADTGSPALAGPFAGASGTPPVPVRMAVGHNLLLAAGLAQMEVPPALLAHFRPQAPGVPAVPPLVAATTPPRTPSRWSVDGWLLLRGDGGGPVSAGNPSYGRSQAGAVLRYDLADASRHRPQAYVRASTALSGPREQDLAAGLSARPAPRWPVRLAVEARASRSADGVELRPAALAVTEFPPLKLPLGVRGEAYLQGGYVGGRFATAFVDGQARVERSLARWQDGELSGGAGAWGGAQKGAARLDIGPTAAVAFRLGEARGRIAADYRFRVAGDAEPASGPALTVSAGF